MSKRSNKKNSDPRQIAKPLVSLMQLCALLDTYVDTEDWEPIDKQRIAAAWRILNRKGITAAMVQKSIQFEDGPHERPRAKSHPGPWHVEGNEIRCEPDDDDGGMVICEMISSRSIGETLANGLLIRSAPELRTILEEITSTRSDIPRIGLSLISLDVIEKAQELMDSMNRSPIHAGNRPSELSQHSCEEIPIPSKQESPLSCLPSSLSP